MADTKIPDGSVYFIGKVQVIRHRTKPMGHSEWVPEHKVGDLQYGVVTFDVRDGKPCTWAFWMIRGATLVDIMSGIRAKRDINDWMSHGGVTSFTPPFAQVLTSFGHSYELSELTPEEIAVAKSELGL